MRKLLITAAVLAALAGAVLAYRLWGAEGATAAAGAAASLLGAAGLLARRRRPREDTGPALAAVDAEADAGVATARKDAADELQEANADAEAVRSGDPVVDAEFLRSLGGHEWQPPVDPRSPTEPG